MDRSMIDAASGGALVDLTPVAAKNLISNMAANSQQFRARADQNPRRVNEVNHSSLEHKVEELTSLMRQFITGSHQQIKSCGICSNIDHATDMCPILHEESCQQANATGFNLLMTPCDELTHKGGQFFNFMFKGGMIYFINTPRVLISSRPKLL